MCVSQSMWNVKINVLLLHLLFKQRS